MLTLVAVLGSVGIVVVAVAWFLLGFRVGGARWQCRLVHTQMEAASARRQLHDLTRQAFVAMADHALRSGRQSSGPTEIR